ncbi:hypothetical protein B9G79_00825 [Bdellovibrio bacteriovorus]|uniref:Uncharacterized protein n=2 Tax=Bdellovibrio bacteriovorus TaxID=959 RepID=A0A1Z3N401_BDEBC|nr:hypothetical protein B9G79_00825 [Bdellovibrio bacteriovorus]
MIMFAKLIAVVTFVFSFCAYASDPNIDSYKKAGECFTDSPKEKCVYCPEKKKFIPLPSSSADTTPKDSDYEFIDKAAPVEDGKQ